jgi:tetratricopeptide (TPR) repeat protein
LVITILVFLPSLRNGFVNWDDDRYLTNNTAVQHISPANIGKIFSSFLVDDYTYEPLTVLSYSPEYHFFKLNPGVYHATNLVLYLFNCLLVFWLIYILSRSMAVAVMTALLFGIHPLHVESVAWIAGRKDILCGLFFLSAMIAYVYHLRQTRLSKPYYFSLIFFVLSLLAKAMAITLPFVLFLLDYFVDRKDKKISFANKIPFFMLSLIFGGIAVFARFSSMNSGAAIHHLHSLSYLDKFLNANFIISFYLIKLLIPIKLSSFYPYQLSLIKPWPIIFMIAPIFSMISGLTIFIFKKTSKKTVFSALFFLIMILPVLQFVQTGLAMVADRYMYLPSLGIFYGISEGIFWFYTRSKRYESKSMLIFFSILLISIGCALGALTWKRCGVWKDSSTLWGDVLNNDPNSAVAYNGLGEFFVEKGKQTEAVALFSKAIEIDPDFFEAYNHRGNVYVRRGSLDQALLDFSKALEIKPNYADAYNNKGDVYARRGNLDQALLDYSKAIGIKPECVEAYSNRGNAYVSRGNFDQAILDFNKAIEINPDYAEVYNNRGIVYARRGSLDRAILDYNKAIEIKFDYAEAYNNRGNAYSRRGNLDRAILDYNRAIEINPIYARAYYNRVAVYYMENKYDKSWEDVHRAEALGITFPPDFLKELRKVSGREK